MSAALANHAARSHATPPLEREELLRYGRHLLLPEVAIDGQRRLKAARVLDHRRRRPRLAGGALPRGGGRWHASGLVDFDIVEVTNLQRQLLHGTRDVGRPKLDSARDRLHDTNPNVKLELHPTRLTSANALTIIREYDLVLDGTDNFATRYLVNDACVLLGKPNVYGSIFRFDGQASVFAHRRRTLLSLPLSRAAAAGPRAELRGRWRARRPAGAGRNRSRRPKPSSSSSASARR